MTDTSLLPNYLSLFTHKSRKSSRSKSLNNEDILFNSRGRKYVNLWYLNLESSTYTGYINYRRLYCLSITVWANSYGTLRRASGQCPTPDRSWALTIDAVQAQGEEAVACTCTCVSVWLCHNTTSIQRSAADIENAVPPSVWNLIHRSIHG